MASDVSGQSEVTSLQGPKEDKFSPKGVGDIPQYRLQQVSMSQAVSAESRPYGQTTKSRRKKRRRHKKDGYILSQGTGSDRHHL